jgi:hypothetical protein
MPLMILSTKNGGAGFEFFRVPTKLKIHPPLRVTCRRSISIGMDKVQQFSKFRLKDQSDGHTIDSIQGGDAPDPMADLARSRKVGFTDDRGRNCVLHTHAVDY